MNMFRTLRADEIDCRISQVKKDGSGLSLLLYKDARCDQNILDEVVGPYKWKREHTRDNRNCIVSIWSDELGQWISKEDTGTESNTEREKGLASDSFKRACFNWGIGRELYTAPFIWVKRGDFNLKEGKCYDRFTVKGIGYTDGVITGLEIMNQATGKICYKWGEITEEAPEKPEQPDNDPETTQERKEPNATVRKGATVPPVQKGMTDEQRFVSCCVAHMKQEIEGFNFPEMRKTLIAEKAIADKSSADMTMDDAFWMIVKLYQRFGNMAEDEAKAKVTGMMDMFFQETSK